MLIRYSNDLLAGVQVGQHESLQLSITYFATAVNRDVKSHFFTFLSVIISLSPTLFPSSSLLGSPF